MPLCHGQERRSPKLLERECVTGPNVVWGRRRCDARFISFHLVPKLLGKLLGSLGTREPVECVVLAPQNDSAAPRTHVRGQHDALNA